MVYVMSDFKVAVAQLDVDLFVQETYLPGGNSSMGPVFVTYFVNSLRIPIYVSYILYIIYTDLEMNVPFWGFLLSPLGLIVNEISTCFCDMMLKREV